MASTPKSTRPTILNFTVSVLMRLLVLVLAVVPSFVQQQVHAAAAQIQSPFARFSTLPALLALLVSDVANSGQFFVQAQFEGYEWVGEGICQDNQNNRYDYIGFKDELGGAVITWTGDCVRLCEAC